MGENLGLREKTYTPREEENQKKLEAVRDKNYKKKKKKKKHRKRSPKKLKVDQAKRKKKY